jgi:acyl dehydratase
MAHVASFASLEIGQKWVGPGRTLTEGDLTMACMISGDWHGIHADAEFSKNTPLGGRIFHGPFIIAIAMGMMANLVEFTDPVLGMLDIRDWAFRKPLFVGDTMHIELTILDKHTTSGNRRGIIDRHIAIINQNGVTVQDGKSKFMVTLGG